jgi:hypothetical protein
MTPGRIEAARSLDIDSLCSLLAAFEPIARAAVPEPVRQSVEFVSACPETAQAMVREIEP